MSAIKEKRDDSLKRLTCADGRKQRALCSKEETNSPTVHTDSFMIITATEALEGRAAYTGDIKGSFLHASQKYFTVIKFVNKEVEILCLMEKNHEQCHVLANSIDYHFQVGIEKCRTFWIFFQYRLKF